MVNGYFAMDDEYLFKSSAQFKEDSYTLALAQHVQGSIPLKNSKIKELDRNHSACSGNNKFVFSLKTSAGEFFLSTHNIQYKWMIGQMHSENYTNCLVLYIYI